MQILANMDPRVLVSCVKKPLVSPTARTYDAGQAYEMISPSGVIRNLEYLLKRAETCGHGLVQVFNFVRSVVGVTKTLHRSVDDRLVLASITILQCLKCYLNMRVYRFGNMFVEQVSGVPIGGWLSSCLLNLTASASESIFEAKWLSFAAPYGIIEPRYKVFAVKRYEDDCLVL